MAATSHSNDDWPGNRAWGHVPGLDGVRGIAVITVLLFHGGVSWARGGFLGVDAFFVLSGLLITSLLLDEATHTGGIALGRFWARRARRLFPALLLVVAAAGLYGAFLADAGNLDALRRDALATLGYVANWRYIAAGANYFEATAAPSVLRHTWSLAIEEQFYVVWPLLMLAVAKRRTPLAWTAVVAGGGALASVVAMWLLFEPGQDPSRAYYGTDTRVHVVLTGAALAAGVAALRRRPELVDRWVRVALGIAAAAGTIVFVVGVATLDGNESVLFRGGFLGVSLAVGAVLLHIVLVPDGWSSRALSIAPLRAAGRISYGLYLWHWPIYLTVTHDRTGLIGAQLLAVRLLATLVMALASYYAVERPIRLGAFPRWQAGLALPVALAVTLVAVVVGTTLPPAEPAVAAPIIPRTQSGFPATRRPPRPAGAPAKVLVVGDSVAKTLADSLARPARRNDLELVNRGVLGCGVVRGGPFRYFGQDRAALPQCQTWPQDWARHVREVDPDVVLLIVGRWEVMDWLRRGRWTRLGQPAFDAEVARELDRAIGILSERGATVAFATAPYFLRGERPDGGRWPEDDPARVDRYNELVRTVADEHADRVGLLDLNGQTSRDGRYTPVVDGIAMRYDGVHFSPRGAAYLGPWLLSALREMAPLPSAPPITVPTPTTRGPQTPPSTRAPRPSTTVAPATTEAPPTTDAPPTTEPPPTTRPPVTLLP